MKAIVRICLIPLLAYTAQGVALSFAPEEFQASRKLACVLAQQSLGQLSEAEYGEKTHTVLDGFDEVERDNILAQAVGYYGGLVFSAAGEDPASAGISAAGALKLQGFLASSTCVEGYNKVTLRL
ncbi:MAG: hypothetical protein KDI33_14810 [Halioglobus sp.]|nr:hypothetical protein [Halioglobus sp.]